jgi:NaMN:DMB phosphoribosyltransferase
MAARVVPEAGFPALRDAVALIRASADRDCDAFAAVLSGARSAVDLAGMTATVAALVCRRAGLGGDEVVGALREIEAELADYLLDQARPEVAAHGG